MKELLNILNAHRYNAEAAVCTCSDTVQVGLKCDKQTHPEHLAEMLKPLLAKVWEAGEVAAIERGYTYGAAYKAAYTNPYEEES